MHILFFHKKLIPKIEYLDLSHNGVLVVDNLQVTSAHSLSRALLSWWLQRLEKPCTPGAASIGALPSSWASRDALMALVPKCWKS